MKNTNWLNLVLLSLAVFFAFVVRFWKISTLSFPPNGDELAFGYYGWSLLHFGTDEYGNFLPLSFPSIGDFKYPALSYLNIIPAAVFGLSEITVRFWNALSGVILVVLIYKLSLFIFERRATAVVSSWLVALSPWSITVSRLGWENHISMVLTTAGILTLLYSSSPQIENLKKKILTITSLILFLISSFTYGAQRVFIPLFLASLSGLTFIKQIGLVKQRKILVFILVVISFVITLSLLPPENRGRSSEEMWKMTSIENDRLEQLYIGAGLSTIKIPPRATWFLHNKYKIAVTSFLERYFEHFGPKFLFFFGEASTEKIPDMGLLLLIELLLLPAGLMTILSVSKKSLIVFFWLILAPIPSALTFGGAHINRASLMIPPIALISGYGFTTLTTMLSTKINTALKVILVFGIIFSSLFALNQIFIQKPLDKPWIKEQVYKDVVLEIMKIKNNYKIVAVGDDDYIYFLFYGKITPQEFLRNADILPLDTSTRWERVNRFDNIFFKMGFDCPRAGKLNVLYVCSGLEVPQNSRVLKTFYYLDKVPAFTFIEFYPVSGIPENLPKLPENLHYMVEVEDNPNFPDGIIPEDYPSLW